MFGRKRIKLQSGVVRFVVPMEDGTSKDWVSDLIVLKIVAENLEEKHALKARSNGRLEATSEFLTELSEALIAEGCPRSTPAIARQVWFAVAEQWAPMESKFQKQLARSAR